MPGKKIINFPLVQSYLVGLAGDIAIKVVRVYERRGGRVTDEELAKKIRVKVTEIRTVLNKLHYMGIAGYKKTKNKRTGWYSYTWAINSRRVVELLLGEQYEAIEKLGQKQDFERDYQLFGCKNNCNSFPFEVAAEYQFKCPECNCSMSPFDSEKRLKDINGQIDKLKKEIGALEKIV